MFLVARKIQCMLFGCTLQQSSYIPPEKNIQRTLIIETKRPSIFWGYGDPIKQKKQTSFYESVMG